MDSLFAAESNYHEYLEGQSSPYEFGGMGVSLSYLSASEGVNFVRSAGQGLGCIVHGLRCGEWPIHSRTARNYYLEGWMDFASVLENHPNARHPG